MSAPSVSVVVPTYNRAAFLGAAVASIRAQTHQCAEIVIVDDGSTDNTTQVVSALGNGIHYVQQANAGPAAARNRGIREANCELVAFLDTDDRWLPDKIARQAALLRRQPGVALVTSDEAMENGIGEMLFPSNFARRGIDRVMSQLQGGIVPNAPRLLLRVNFISTSTVLARRSVLTDLNGFDPHLRFGEDLELWLRIAARHDIACVPSVEAVRVTHESNTTNSVEPMLRGYVDLAEVIRGWASDLMPKWGMSADRYVADSLADLGYWYFSQDRMREARSTFARSLQERTTRRALIYGAASALPVGLIGLIRRAKSHPGRAADVAR